MKTIKIIDLLNKIAKGEEVPKKIWLRRIWRVPMTYSEEAKDYYCTNNPNGIFEDYFKSYNKEDFNLNEEVEIIEEEKEIEKIKSNGIDFYSDCINVWINKEETVAYCEFLMNKVNEVIDAVNELRKEK